MRWKIRCTPQNTVKQDFFFLKTNCQMVREKYSFEEFVSDPKTVPSSEDILQGFTQENT
jgi:hypothetical protein